MTGAGAAADIKVSLPFTIDLPDDALLGSARWYDTGTGNSFIADVRLDSLKDRVVFTQDGTGKLQGNGFANGDELIFMAVCPINLE